MLDIEDCTNSYNLLVNDHLQPVVMHTDRPKVTHKQCFFPILNHFWHEPIGQKDCRDATECEYEKAKSNQSSCGDAGCVRHVEVVPWNDCSNIHESTEI